MLAAIAQPLPEGFPLLTVHQAMAKIAPIAKGMTSTTFESTKGALEWEVEGGTARPVPGKSRCGRTWPGRNALGTVEMDTRRNISARFPKQAHKNFLSLTM